MNIRYCGLLLLFVIIGFTACNDEDYFSSSSEFTLSFENDSIQLDTVFSNVPSSAKSFWIYNRSGAGIKCSNVRLDRGNQTGFRVNVDGIYLGKEVGYQTSDIEVRNGDSIRVYVEVTPPVNHQQDAKRVEDALLFTLESGKVQKVHLSVYSWDAIQLNQLHISSDTVIASERPILVKNGITVDSAATLTIQEGTSLYFNHNAGIDVYGRLIVEGTAAHNVVLRGSRLDAMFDYLPYDRLSGQWQGIHYFSSSFDNQLKYVDIHGAFNGITIDSTDIARETLAITSSTIHNCQGYGVNSRHAKWTAVNTLFSNTLNDCVYLDGGEAELMACTLAQFYPFDAKRGVALHIDTKHFPVSLFKCTNTLITGYANNEILKPTADSAFPLKFHFESCLLRTSIKTPEDSLHFTNVIFENVNDTLLAGAKNFKTVDTDSLKYNFELRETSLAIDKATQVGSPLKDRKGAERGKNPDIGAFEYIKPKQR